MRLGNLLIENPLVLHFGGAAGETPWGQALAAMVGLAAACILLSWYLQRGKDYYWRVLPNTYQLARLG